MLGAIIGDTVGSVYEFNNIKTPNFQPLFAEEADFTDDSILSVAIADWLVNTARSQHSLEDVSCLGRKSTRIPWAVMAVDSTAGSSDLIYCTTTKVIRSLMENATLIIVAGMEVPCAFLHVAGLHVQLMRRLTSPNAPPR